MPTSDTRPLVTAALIRQPDEALDRVAGTLLAEPERATLATLRSATDWLTVAAVADPMRLGRNRVRLVLERLAGLKLATRSDRGWRAEPWCTGCGCTSAMSCAGGCHWVYLGTKHPFNHLFQRVVDGRRVCTACVAAWMKSSPARAGRHQPQELTTP